MKRLPASRIGGQVQRQRRRPVGDAQRQPVVDGFGVGQVVVFEDRQDGGVELARQLGEGVAGLDGVVVEAAARTPMSAMEGAGSPVTSGSTGMRSRCPM